MGSELPRIALLILYKKGYKRPSHRGFGLYMEGEMGRKSFFGGPEDYAVSASEAFQSASLGFSIKWM
jgi:hypothetical protein